MRYPTAVLRLGLLALLLFVLPASGALPAVEIVSADLGWGRQVRPDRWNVATVRLKAETPVEAVLEWYVPRPRRAAMVLHQPVVLNPQAGTYVSPLPVGPDAGAIHLRVADAETGQTLAHWPPQLRAPTALLNRVVLSEGAGATPFVGVSGEGAALGWLSPGAVVGYREPVLLPGAPIGYNALDVLALNRPDLAAMSTTQQQAIADWVRAGGELWVWLGIDPLPAPSQSPIVALLEEALPALPTEVTTLANGNLYRHAPSTAEDPPLITDGTAGEGRIVFLHVAPTALPAVERERLKGSLAVRPGAGETVVLDLLPWRPKPIWLLIAFVIGPLDWIVTWITGRLIGGRVRRQRLWLTLPGTVAFLALVIWQAQTPPAGLPAELAEPSWTFIDGNADDGPIRDVPLRLTPDGVAR